jgi:hypothetical protein
VQSQAVRRGNKDVSSYLGVVAASNVSHFNLSRMFGRSGRA